MVKVVEDLAYTALVWITKNDGGLHPLERLPKPVMGCALSRIKLANAPEFRRKTGQDPDQAINFLNGVYSEKREYFALKNRSKLGEVQNTLAGIWGTLDARFKLDQAQIISGIQAATLASGVVHADLWSQLLQSAGCDIVITICDLLNRTSLEIGGSAPVYFTIVDRDGFVGVDVAVTLAGVNNLMRVPLLRTTCITKEWVTLPELLGRDIIVDGDRRRIIQISIRDRFGKMWLAPSSFSVVRQASRGDYMKKFMDDGMSREDAIKELRKVRVVAENNIFKAYLDGDKIEQQK